MPHVVAVNTAISARTRRILEYENDGLVYEIMDKLDISMLRAYDHLHELKLYLLLCTLNPGEELPVPAEIDRVLHIFLDRRQEFDSFCRDCMEGTLEHIPYHEPLAGGALRYTIERARATFAGRFYQRLWERELPVCTCRFKQRLPAH